MSILTYNGKKFNQRNSDGFVNLGQLCATHGKKFGNWSRLESSHEHLKALAETLNQSESHIWDTENLVLSTSNAIGGRAGTWGHPLVALEVARWINPSFGVWCNLHIKTLIETGSTSLSVKDENWGKKRLEGKKARRDFTDAIDAYKQRHKDELSAGRLHWMYSNASDAINLGLCGKKASALAALLGCAPADLRNHLSQKELTVYLAVEEMSAWLIESQDMDPILAVKDVIAKNYYLHRFADKYKQLAEGKEVPQLSQTPPALPDK